MPHLTANMPRRAALAALALLCRPAPVAAAADTPGAYALPDGQAKVSATLSLAPAGSGAPAGTRVLDVAMTRLGAARPITRYEVELSKRLHLIGVSADLATFLHDHAEQPGADGHFRVPMTFPRGGVWHVFADAVPTGLGQQVMRFDVNLDGAAPLPRPTPALTGLDGSDGRYGVRFDALELRAGQEAHLRMHILRDGKAAPDLRPYLGVAAHAVLISAADLTYVHAHAAPAASPTMHHMAGAAMHPDGDVPPELALHVQAPKAGRYVMWLQFEAGGQVRTVRFVVGVS